MSFRAFFYDSLWLILFGLSLLSGTFVIGLLMGTAVTHPVLGPLASLWQYIQTIVGSAIAVALSRQLATPPLTRKSLR